jgi:hypothetical protein
MYRQPVSSSWVARVGYDPDTLTLEVELLDGALYRYFDVPEHEANELVAADSVGTCLNEKIKGRYRYRRG